MQEHELVIIGGGIAGIASAVYATRAGLECVIFEARALGGQLMYVDRVDNYPGIALKTKGADLAAMLTKTVRDLAIAVNEAQITGIEVKNDTVALTTEEATYAARSVIIATGAEFKRLGIPGEAEFFAKGVSWCAVCDGFFFKGKEVAVIGGGNSAVEEALYLSGICKKVYLIHRRDTLRALDYLQKELFAKPNIEVIWNSTPKSIEGDEFLKQVILFDQAKKKEHSLAIDGLFIAIGIRPNTELFKDSVAIDEGGFILTDNEMRTKHPAIFACGDCRRRPLRQLITASGEGAVAALGAYRYLRNSYISS